MRLIDLLAEDRIEPAFTARSKEEALDALALLLARGVDGSTPEAIAKVLREREALASTGVGDEVAIPHGRLAGLKQVVAAIALAPGGVEFDAQDHRPVKIFVAILAPERSASDHLRALARCSKLLRDDRVREELLRAGTRERVLEIVRNEAN